MSDTDFVQIRLPARLGEELRKIAKAERRTLTGQAEVLIENGIEFFYKPASCDADISKRSSVEKISPTNQSQSSEEVEK